MGKSTIDGYEARDAAGAPTQVGSGQMPPDSSAGPSGGGLTRVTVNLTRPAVQAMDALSEGTGNSKTDTINRALQIYALIHGIMERSGGSLNIVNADGQIERIHIV